MRQAQSSSTKQGILLHLRKHGSATAQDLAEQMQVSPQGIRRHLKDLEHEGLISYDTTQTGMGRPQHVYSLSQLGSEQFPGAYDEFALELMKTLSETVPSEVMGTILQRQWERKAEDYRLHMGQGSLQERVEALVQLRQAEGFMAEYHVLPASNEGTDPAFVLTEHHCAISQIAQTFPSVCGHELEMFAAALQGCRVERINWQVDGQHQCGYLITTSATSQSLNSLEA